MTEPIRVFVNERPVSVPAGADARAAVAAHDPELAARLDADVRLTDARGIAVDPATPLHAGSILRVAATARRDADDDAHEEPDADA
jgi:hypothetical protein